MNNFDVDGITYMDLTTTERNQIPTMPAIDFRGFCCVTASGQYAVFIPFYAGYFSGQTARTKASKCGTLADFAHCSQSSEYPMDDDLQNLNLAIDRDHPDLMVGFRGGMVSLWPVTL